MTDVINLRILLCEIDDRRFEDIVHVLGITDKCGMCDFFNLSIKDKTKQYRCRSAPKCIAATLHPDVIVYLNTKMGWV